MTRTQQAVETPAIDGPTAPVTIRDVAARAGVSVATVSNVLNRPSVVAPVTLDRVQAAIAELGFVRHAGAALMRKAYSRIIGLVVLDVTNPFFTELASGAEAAASDENHLLVLCNSRDDRGQERRYLTALQEQRVVGVLISPVDEQARELEELRRRGRAVVLLERPRPGFCSVRTDDAAGGQLAGDHLLDLGHRRLVFVSASITIPQYRDRLHGLRQAMRRRHLPPDALQVMEVGTVGTVRDGRLAAAQILDQETPATGIVCGNDLIALGVVGGLLQAGASVPGRWSVVGYDDIELAAQSGLPITTVRQPAQRMGDTAARLAISEALEGADHHHQQVVFQPELVVRQSTAQAPESP